MRRTLLSPQLAQAPQHTGHEGVLEQLPGLGALAAGGQERGGGGAALLVDDLEGGPVGWFLCVWG